MENILHLHVPAFSELDYRRSLLSDPRTMAYNVGYPPFDGYDPTSGCIAFSVDRWADWYESWIGNEPERYCAYLANGNGTFVGEVNFHFDAVSQVYLVGIVIDSRYRGHKYGVMGLSLLIDKARSFGIKRLQNEFPPSRRAAKKAHLAAGFAISGQNGENDIYTLAL